MSGDERELSAGVEVVYGFNQVWPLFETWQVAVLVAAIGCVAGLSLWVLLRDARSVAPGIRWLLVALRLLALACLVLFIFEPQKSTRSQSIKRSRLPVLIDTSLSMSLQDAVDGTGARRIDSVIMAVSNPEFWRPLVEQHDVEIYRFDESSSAELLAASRSFAEAESAEVAVPMPAAVEPDAPARSRQLGLVGFGLFSLGVLLLMIEWAASRRGRGDRWWLAGGWLALTAAVVAVAACDLATPQRNWAESLALVWEPTSANNESLPTKTATTDFESVANKLAGLNWDELLAPRGAATRLGDVLEALIQRERGGPIAGCLVISDGAANSGVELSRVGLMAETAGVPLFPIGVGSSEAAKNIEIVSWQLPAKAFPKDRFIGRAVVQHSGFRGAVARLQVVSTDEREQEPEVIEDEIEIVMETDNQPQSIDIELQRESIGVRRYKIRIPKFPDELDEVDNVRSAAIEIIDRKTVILLVAGGPHRDFQFLRNQLHRDPAVELHVWLQSAKAGANQEGDKLLTEFPRDAESLDEIDCIVAFDPDWSLFTEEQAALLEDWLASRAGGLVVTAGPVNTPLWTRLPPRHPVATLIRRIYPVVFYNQSSAVLSLGRFGGERAWPLEFTREGMAAEFLWLADNREENEQVWQQFAGVYGYYAVNEAKPGAEILAYFSDPKTAVDDRLPIYLASQLYGSGRVLFQASNETWRMRRQNIDYFQIYYDRLIRWASQGRLNRNAKNGTLVTDRQNYWVGEQVWVQANLPAGSVAGLVDESLSLDVVMPDGERTTATLQVDPAAPRAGTLTGTLVVSRAGDYRLGLLLPQRAGEMLTTQVSVRIPDLEKQNPLRNDQGLQEIADQSGGRYWRGFGSLLGSTGQVDSFAGEIPPQDQVSILPGSPDKQFRQKLMAWLLVLATFVLASHWTIRRLNKLA
jgi:hypothetical protein